MDTNKSKQEELSTFTYYLAYELGLSENTVIAYQCDIKDWRNFLGKNLVSGESKDIILYMRELRSRGLSIETILRRLAAISQLYDFLIQEKLLSSNPVEFIVKPQKWEKLPIYLDFYEVDKLLNAPDVSNLSGYRDMLMLETLYASGLRVTELLTLLISNIDFNRCLLKVQGKGSKERYVPIYKRLAEKIYLWLPTRFSVFVKSNDPGYLFLNRRGKKLTRQYFWERIKFYCKSVGIEKNISPHTLRHCFATHLLSGGADLRTIQLFLGHENVGTTEIYTHISDDKKRDTLMNFHPAFRK